MFSISSVIFALARSIPGKCCVTALMDVRGIGGSASVGSDGNFDVDDSGAERCAFTCVSERSSKMIK